MKWWLLMLTFVSIGIYVPVNAEKYKASPLCEAMKKLPHNGHKDIYQAYVESLYQADKTVCSCMQEIMQAKRKNVETLLGEDVAQKIRDEENRIQKLNNERTEIPCVTCDPEISINVCNNIKKEYRKTGLKADLEIMGDLTGVRGEFPSYYLGIDDNFLSQSLSTQNGILGHEFDHLREKCRETELIIIQNKVNWVDYLTWRRYLEKRADRISTACGSLNNACGLYACFRYYWYLNPLKTLSEGMHPTIQKRFEWALRIFRLKKAEETVLKIRQMK